MPTGNTWSGTSAQLTGRPDLTVVTGELSGAGQGLVGVASGRTAFRHRHGAMGAHPHSIAGHATGTTAPAFRCDPDAFHPVLGA